MTEKIFSLKDIKLLANHYYRVGTPGALSLFQVIQAYYPLGKNPDHRDPIDPPSARKLLEYKIARGGNFITHYKHIALR